MPLPTSSPLIAQDSPKYTSDIRDHRPPPRPPMEYDRPAYHEDTYLPVISSHGYRYYAPYNDGFFTIIPSTSDDHSHIFRI